jgi:2-keto-4-pentenoate hydratase/2-oxohepta-3-ene-1,7-dioic acid hydratase in catechol pathway
MHHEPHQNHGLSLTRRIDMTQNRRELLKLAGLTGVTGVLSAGVSSASEAVTPRGLQVFPKELTCATMVTARGASLGVRTARGVLDVGAAEDELRQGLPKTVDDLLHQRGDLQALARLIENGAAKAPARYLIAEKDVRFGPCVTNPEKVICLGKNYREHAAETGSAPPTTPILFNKFKSSLNNHGGTIKISAEAGKNWDYEAEMVIVIGRTARNVAEADAPSYVFGYCTGQDFSARDLQNLNSQWMLGKAGDGWGPIGPWLVSADQVDPDNLDIKMIVNGEVRQSSNTRNMIFNTRYIVSYISRHMTLNAGDVIFTGTPEGVILGYPKDKQVWLKPGDKLLTSIEKLGDQEIALT